MKSTIYSLLPFDNISRFCHGVTNLNILGIVVFKTWLLNTDNHWSEKSFYWLLLLRCVLCVCVSVKKFSSMKNTTAKIILQNKWRDDFWIKSFAQLENSPDFKHATLTSSIFALHSTYFFQAEQI